MTGKLRVRTGARVARRSSTSQPSYGLFIDGEFVDTVGRARRSRRSTRPTEEVLAEVAEAGAADVDRAVAAARARVRQGRGRRCRARERGKYLFRIARIAAGARARARRARVARQRQADPRVARRRHPAGGSALLLLRRLGRQARATPGFGPDPRPIGVAGQVIPWNFPLLMLAWKIAPALACGNTVVLKPAETTPLTALLFAEICQQADLPPGVVNILTGAGETGRALVEHAGVDKVAFTGSTEVGKQIARAIAGTRKKVTLELGGKAANIVFDDAPIDQAVEGIVNGIFFNQGHVCCAGSRLLVQESVADEVVDRLKRRLDDAAGRRPAGQEHRHRRDQLRRAAGPDPRAVRGRRGRGRRALVARRATLPDKGFWFAPTVFTGVSQAHRIAREEIFGPVLSVLTFRTPDEAVEKANNTPYGLSAGVWTDKGSPHPLDGATGCAPAWSGPTRSTGSTRRRRSAATRSRATAARAAATGWRPTLPTEVSATSRDRRPQDLQALHRRRVPAQRVRPLLRGHRRQGRLPRQRGAGLPQGRARRGRRRAQGVPRLVRARPRTTAARCSTGSPRCWRAGARSSSTRSRAARASRARKAERSRRRGRSTAGSGTPAGPTRSPRCSAAQTRCAGPYFDFSVPEPTGVVAVLAPQDSSLLGLVSVDRAGHRHRQHRRRRCASETRPLPAITLAEVLATSDVPGGVVNILTGARAEVAPVAGRRTWTSTRSTSPGAGRRRAPTSRRAAADNLKRVAAADRRARRDWTADARTSSRLRAFLETKTVWHPIGV